MSVTGGIMAGIGAAGAIGGAAISSNAAGNAADAQSAAANHAADLQYQASQNALAFQKQQWNQQQANMAPWLATGGEALGNLGYLLGLPSATTQGTMTGNPQFGTTGLASGRGTPGFGSNTPLGMRPSAGLVARGGPIANPGGDGYQPIGLQAHPGMDTGMGHITGGPVQGSAFQPQTPSTSLPGYAHPGTTGPMQFGGTAGGGNAPHGTTNLGATVDHGLGGFGSLMQANPYSTFTAPTGLTMQNDPGYQARLQLGQDAMERSAAARGSLLTGGTLQSENQAAQNFASNEYQNMYDRAYNTNAFKYNAFNQNQTNQYNRLAALAGVGQQSAQTLGMLGNDASQGITANLLNTAQNMGQSYQNAAAANASGMVGSANAWSGALGGTTNNLSQLLMMQQLFGGGGGSDLAGYAGMGV